MKQVYGLQFQFSTYERGLWYDSDKGAYNPKGWGIKLAVLCGKWISPQPRFWSKEYRNGNPDYNPWFGKYRWFVFRFPFIIAPFLSISIGRFGFYIGWKDYGANRESHPAYADWMKPDELGADSKNENIYLCETASLRKNRW